MFLFFHDIGMPVWGVFLFLFGILTSPVFGILGIYYLIYKQYKQTTFVLSALVIFFLAFAYHLFNISSNLSIDFFAYITAPFGSTLAILLAILGMPYILVYAIGMFVNFLAIFGLVRFVEKRF